MSKCNLVYLLKLILFNTGVIVTYMNPCSKTFFSRTKTQPKNHV